MLKKNLLTKIYLYFLGALVLITLIFLLIANLSKTIPPTLVVNIPEGYSTEDFLNISGNVSVQCLCNIILQINGENVPVEKSGSFVYAVKVLDEEDQKEITVKATAVASFWNTSNKVSEINKILERISLPLTIEAPENSSKDTNVINIQTLPGADISITGYHSKSIGQDLVSHISPLLFEADESGKATISLPFDTSIFTYHSFYKIKVDAQKYKSTIKTLKITNDLYSLEEVNKKREHEIQLAEEARKYEREKEKEKEDQERAKKIKEDMNKYVGNEIIQLAIANNVEKSRTIGSYYVTDYSNYQYVQIAVSIANIGNSSTHVNPLYFTIMDDSGQTYNTDSAMYSINGRFESTNLQPGGKTDGWLVFILPKNKREFTLVYSTGFDKVVRKQFITH